jgi:hypothetical protein
LKKLRGVVVFSRLQSHLELFNDNKIRQLSLDLSFGNFFALRESVSGTQAVSSSGQVSLLWEGAAMSATLFEMAATCETHQGLLDECNAARSEWNARRGEISKLGLRGKKIDNELMRLQAKFAKSYAMVRTHLRGCECCQSARGAYDIGRYQDHGRVVPELHIPLFSGTHQLHR